MTVELYPAFVFAATLILILPGPTIILVISQAVSHGRRSVVPLVAGVLLGDLTAMTLSLMGLGALLSVSAALFGLFKWIGAVYLFYLGINLWRLDPGKDSIGAEKKEIRARSIFRSSFIVTALNPKSIAFFVAFLPQFINPYQPMFSQIILLGVTFLSLATLNATLYALFAGQLRETMRNSHVRRWFNRCGGSGLIGAGVITAGMHRAAQ